MHTGMWWYIDLGACTLCVSASVYSDKLPLPVHKCIMACEIERKDNEAFELWDIGTMIGPNLGSESQRSCFCSLHIFGLPVLYLIVNWSEIKKMVLSSSVVAVQHTCKACVNLD